MNPILTYVLCIFTLILIVYSYGFLLNLNKSSLGRYIDHMKTSEYNNRKRKKHEVVFLLSYDYKELPLYAVYSILLLKKYCNKHKYKIILKNHYPNDKISPYWLRVFDLYILSKLHSDDTIFVYLDLDTAINPKYFTLKIEDLLDSIDLYENKEYSIYIGRDQDAFKLVNTGVIFIRNGEPSRNIIEEWKKRYNPKSWNKKEDKWICSKNNDSQCNWALDNYEQGEFTNMYKNNITNTKTHTKILNSFICSNKILNIDSFIYHFMGNKTQLNNFKYLYNITKLKN